MKRPTFLTIWLALLTIADVYSIYSYTLGAAVISRVLPNIPSWAYTVLALLAVSQLVAAVMLWMWKKMGFYVYIAGGVLATLVNVSIFGAAGIGTGIFAVIGAGILYLAMKPAWKNFK